MKESSDKLLKNTVCPYNNGHILCFAVFCCSLVRSFVTMSLRVTSSTLGQSYDWNWYHNHKATKHSKNFFNGFFIYRKPYTVLHNRYGNMWNNTTSVWAGRHFEIHGSMIEQMSSHCSYQGWLNQNKTSDSAYFTKAYVKKPTVCLLITDNGLGTMHPILCWTKCFSVPP